MLNNPLTIATTLYAWLHTPLKPLCPNLPSMKRLARLQDAQPRSPHGVLRITE